MCGEVYLTLTLPYTKQAEQVKHTPPPAPRRNDVHSACPAPGMRCSSSATCLRHAAPAAAPSERPLRSGFVANRPCGSGKASRPTRHRQPRPLAHGDLFTISQPVLLEAAGPTDDAGPRPATATPRSHGTVGTVGGGERRRKHLELLPQPRAVRPQSQPGGPASAFDLSQIPTCLAVCEQRVEEDRAEHPRPRPATTSRSRAALTAPSSAKARPDWRRQGVDAMLARDLPGAVFAFGQALAEAGTPESGRLEMLRLRCAALLRLERFGEVLHELDGATREDNGHGPSGRVQAAAHELLHLRAVALLAIGRNEEAAKSLSLALGREGGGSRGRRFETLSGLFIKAAVAAPHCALVPLQAYLPPEQPDACGSSHSRNSRGPLSTRRDQAGGALAPVFRIVLRPRSPPWPMRLVIPRKTDTWTLAFYCTPRQPGPAASEAPHVRLTSAESSSPTPRLVQIDVRVDGIVEAGRPPTALFPS